MYLKSSTLVCICFLSGCNQEEHPGRTHSATAGGSRPVLSGTPQGSVSGDPEYSWRSDPALQGRFHPDHPDDLQVIMHEGGPRISDRRPEVMWVRVTGMRGDAYVGSLQNEPHHLRTFKLGQSILFLLPKDGEYPILVTERYLKERKEWRIRACDKCGLSELFDAPSDLQAKIFPNIPADAKLDMFTSLCPLCGGVQVVSSADKP